MTKLNVVTTGTPTISQKTKIASRLQALFNDPEFSDVTFLINGDYIGGRPNDRG